MRDYGKARNSDNEPNDCGALCSYFAAVHVVERMRILFVHPRTYVPEIYAGTEVTTHWLCRALVDHGHEVVIAAMTSAEIGTGARVDRGCGYPVYRAQEITYSIAAARAHFPADVFVLTTSDAWIAQVMRVIKNTPAIVYAHDMSHDPRRVPEELNARALYIANSPATAKYLSDCGIASTVVPPIFGIEQYAGIERRGKKVLFVSLQHRKGADIAIRIARQRPDIPFVFAESWSQDMPHTEILRKVVGRMSNIRHVPNQMGLRHILPQIKLLLMPSRSQEAWGRTATEAQICGIPVLGSSRGNLSATIGAGGITLDPDDPFENWLEAFDRIMNDSSVYEDLARKARERGTVMLEEVKRAYEAFEGVLSAAVAKTPA